MGTIVFKARLLVVVHVRARSGVRRVGSAESAAERWRKGPREACPYGFGVKPLEKPVEAEARIVGIRDAFVVSFKPEASLQDALWLGGVVHATGRSSPSTRRRRAVRA